MREVANPNSTSKDKKEVISEYMDDYTLILQDVDPSKEGVEQIQWNKEGDYFQQCTLYDDSSPVHTSGNTILINCP
ncbi:MAG: hypothetical protein GY751_12190 [Bacteroidetes bacterium]|nr:hypothetical protein [Bacteroidota bacterium]